MQASSDSWNLIFCRPNGEERAASHLERQNISAYLPRYRTIAGTLKPLFPRYLFAKLNPGDHHKVERETVGISGLVRVGARFAELPYSWIEVLQRDEAMELNDEKRVAHMETFPKDAQLRIINGPFSGITGRFLAMQPHQRVLVMLNMLGAQRPVGVPIDEVEQIS
jgi:transcriptional antiterminator RfaH